MTEQHPNPYVGPRSFQINEPLYGRERELRQLTDRLLAERIVLLHSPSGAGKTSLVQAGLIPGLRAEGFYVHHVVRVNLERPLELLNKADTVDDAQLFNRYTFSTLLSLEEAYPPEKRVDLPRLSRMSLDDYLEFRSNSEQSPEPEFLAFDQFEEILTVDPAERNGKNAFFYQLGLALKNRNRWALFLMREDYLGALEPYVRSVPTYFANTFRLDLLGVKSALDAIQKPARAAGMDFTDEAANKLVDDLRRVQTQRLDGGMETTLGPYVEPVQLQVVCYRLWETLDFSDHDINLDDVAAVGDVDQSLAEYYTLSVDKTALETGVSERAIRDWFENRLISVEGIRGQVLMGADTSDGLENKAVRLLEDAHIIRAEKRAGATWFELAHDRLIVPVRRSNAAWYQNKLSIFQRQAVLWSQQGRSEGLLLRGKELDEAFKQADKLALTITEKAYLDACLDLRKRDQRDRRQRQYIGIGLAAALIFLVMAVIGLIAANQARTEALRSASIALTSQADAVHSASSAQTAQADTLTQKKEAEKQAEISLIRQLGAQAVVQAQTKPDLAMLLAAESSNLQSRLGEGPSPEIDRNLLTTMSSGPRPLKYLRGHTGAVYDVAISPDSSWIASASADQTIRIWDIASGDLLFTLTAHVGEVNSLAFAPNSQPPLLASTGQDGTVRLWQWTDNSTPPQASLLLKLNEPMHALAFSPTASLLAIGGEDKLVHVFDLETKKMLHTFSGHKGIIESLAFSQDGNRLASTDTQSGLRLWDLTRTDAVDSSTPEIAPDLNLHTVTFSPEGQFLVAGFGTTTSWFSITNQPVPSYYDLIKQPLIEHTSVIRDIAFNADGTRFASASEDWRIGYCYDYFIDPRPGCRHIIFLNAHDGPVNSLAFSPDNKWLVSGGDDGIVLVWNAYNPYVSRSLFAPPVQGKRWNIQGLAFSPDSKLLASSDWDLSVRLWDVEHGTMVREFYPNQGTLGTIVISPDGTKLAFAAEYGPQRIWNLDGSVFRQLPIQNFTTAVAFSPDGKWLATDNDNGKSICLWSLGNQTDICQPVPGNGTVSTFAFSPDSHVLATDLGARVVLWDFSIQPPTSRVLGSHNSGIFSLAFSPNGKWLASAGSDYTVRQWGLQSAQAAPFVLRNSGRYSRMVAFSPDGRMLVSANEDWTVRWWDVDTGEPIAAPLKVRFDRLDSVAFSPDGKWLATGSFDGIIDIWPGVMTEWKAAACKIANRNLTYAEWALYIGNSLPFQAVCPNLPVEKSPAASPTR